MLSTLKIAALFGGLTIAFLSGRAFLHTAPSSALSLTTPSKGFAVVELFTSEGCSTCPPADQLVARIQQEDKDKPVYILAYHVDYWNRLGWTDSFSDARYSERQRSYGVWLNLSTVYTPQIIVNGKKEFVGSQESTLRSAIKDGLRQSPSVQITLNVVKITEDKVSWSADVSNAGPNRSIEVALVQRSAITEVKAGENGGHTLSHVQIVRDFSVTPVSAGNLPGGSLHLPPGLNAKDAVLIAFVADDRSAQIVAATRAALQ